MGSVLNFWCAIVLCAIFTILEGAGPQSPCPSIFQYQFDGGDWYGIITIPSLPYGTAIKLNVRLSIARALPTKYAGGIILLVPRTEILQSILNQRAIQYKVLFPLSFPVPQVTAITLNQQIICSGHAASGPIITSISLEHTLYPSGQNLNSNLWPSGGTQSIFPVTNPPVPRTLRPHDIRFNDLHTTTPSTSNVNPFPDIDFRPLPTDEPILKPSSGRRNIYSDICGSPTILNPLIANGKPVQRGAYPWLTAIFVQKPLGVEFVCGGNLISKKHVITAAHCIKLTADSPAQTPDEVLVMLGKYKIHKWTEPGSMIKDAEEIHIHPDYKFLNADADLAVIVLTEEVIFTALVRPICILPNELDLSELVGKFGTIVGWGRDETGLQITSEPRETKVKVVSQESCLRSHWRFRDITSHRTLCAGGEKGAGPCTGDSGGGLLISHDNRWYLRGIVSMSLSDAKTGCDLKNYAVFVDMAKFVEWVSQFVE